MLLHQLINMEIHVFFNTLNYMSIYTCCIQIKFIKIKIKIRNILNKMDLLMHNNSQT